VRIGTMQNREEPAEDDDGGIQGVDRVSERSCQEVLLTPDFGCDSRIVAIESFSELDVIGSSQTDEFGQSASVDFVFQHRPAPVVDRGVNGWGILAPLPGIPPGAADRSPMQDQAAPDS